LSNNTVLRNFSWECRYGRFQSAIQQAQTEGCATNVDACALQAELEKVDAAPNRNKNKDCYKILAVSRRCIGESLKHHPDEVRFFSSVGLGQQVHHGFCQ
jgi:hypothetical protein